MKFKEAFAVYFSPTGNSRKCAVETASTIGRSVREVDMTKASAEFENMEFGINDFVVFSAPVYGGRLYKGFAERLGGLKGNLAKCAVIVTYGNRAYDDALLEFKNILIERGFIPLGFAAIVGRHTYGQIQVDRPDTDDLKMCWEFGKCILEKIDGGFFHVPDVPGNFPYKDGGNGGSFFPSTSDKCRKCGLCARDCPQEAISGDNYDIVDTTKCISCFRCIRGCPFGARVMDTDEYRAFAEMFTKKLSRRCENEIFL